MVLIRQAEEATSIPSLAIVEGKGLRHQALLRNPEKPHVLHRPLGLLTVKACCCMLDRLTSWNHKLPGRTKLFL